MEPITRDVSADVWEGFSAWFVHQELGLTEASPAAFLPRSFGVGPVLLLEAGIKLPLPFVGSLFRSALNILGGWEDSMPPGAAVPLRLLTGFGGRGSKGWLYLGPVAQVMLATDAAGQMDGVRAWFLQLAWRTLLETAPTWVESEYGLRPVVVHSRPMVNADLLGGWASTVRDVMVPRGRLSSLSRRTRPPGPLAARLLP